MGRRSIDISDPSRWVFNRLARDYGCRPPYPLELAARVLEIAGGEGARIADLGAGTGHLALPLARLGARVTAVEPAREMLAALAARDPEGTVGRVHAAAERTGLPAGAFDLVLVADAIQWVDPELAGKEAGRLLGPGGCAAVLEAEWTEGSLSEALARLVTRANPKASARPLGRARQFLTLAAGSSPAAERFAQDAPLSPAELEAVLRSFSTVGPALGPAAFERLVAQARALAARQGGARYRRRLTLTWGRRRGHRGRPPS